MLTLLTLGGRVARRPWAASDRRCATCRRPASPGQLGKALASRPDLLGKTMTARDDDGKRRQVWRIRSNGVYTVPVCTPATLAPNRDGL